MLTYREYRQLAETCVGWARKAKSKEERRTFTEMAAAWMILAAKAQRAHIIRTVNVALAEVPLQQHPSP
jgi:hypothetical protein